MRLRPGRLFKAADLQLKTRAARFAGEAAPTRVIRLAGGAAVTLGGALAIREMLTPVHAEESDPCRGAQTKPAASVHETRVYSVDDIRQMVANGRIVVALRAELFDVTDFTGHPGGVGRLQLAAGGDLEVFWKTYTQHNRGHIDKVMRPYRIGTVSDASMRAITTATHFDASAYQNDPPPSEHLLTNTRHPYNAEGRLSEVGADFITPIGRHFVRNHASVPDLHPNEYLLTVSGEGLVETTFTLEELKTRFEAVEVTTVIQCNGNRREDYHLLDGETPAFGPPHWVAGAIANATWSGPRLRDVLQAAGMDVDGIALGKQAAPVRAEQVGLVGYDHDEVGNQYCCSFPFDKAIDPMGDVILATHMNGQPIPRQHGYPVRAIIPGHAGARNCKFLESVTVTDTPCECHKNWKQYAVHAPDVPIRKLCEFEKHKAELTIDAAVQEMPVQSLITSPSAGDVLSALKRGDDAIEVRGVAWGGGGQGVNRVDVSLDDGANFTRAEMLEKPIHERRKSQWSWVLFRKRVPLPEELRAQLHRGEQINLVLTSKALNAAWNVQPERPLPNPHGCCVNHWYRVPVTICPRAPHDVKAPEGEFANKPSGGRFKSPFCNLDSPEEARVRQAAAARPWKAAMVDATRRLFRHAGRAEIREMMRPSLPPGPINPAALTPAAHAHLEAHLAQVRSAGSRWFGLSAATRRATTPAEASLEGTVNIAEGWVSTAELATTGLKPNYLESKKKPKTRQGSTSPSSPEKSSAAPAWGDSPAPAPFDALGVSKSPLVLATPSAPATSFRLSEPLRPQPVRPQPVHSQPKHPTEPVRHEHCTVVSKKSRRKARRDWPSSADVMAGESWTEVQLSPQKLGVEDKHVNVVEKQATPKAQPKAAAEPEIVSAECTATAVPTVKSETPANAEGLTSPEAPVCSAPPATTDSRTDASGAPIDIDWGDF